MKKLYLNIPSEDACAYYRATLPGKFLKEPLEKLDIDLTTSAILDTTQDYDAYIFHRIYSDKFWPVVEELREKGKVIGWELDDDLWNIPDWSPKKRVIDVNAVNRAMSLADFILPSTEALEDVIDQPHKTLYCPNLIDIEPYAAGPRKEGDDEPLRILWAGGETHEKDIDLLKDAVLFIREEYRSIVQFLFFGYFPEWAAKWKRICGQNLAIMEPAYENIGFVYPVPLDEYIGSLLDIAPNIALLPLVDHPFNSCKSAIKYYEMTMAGAACVASLVGPYARCGAGPLSGLETLIEDPIYRRTAQQVARMNIRQFSWQDSRLKEKWIHAFRTIVNK